MFPIAAAAWLLLFTVLLVVPPSSRPRRGGDERPAVISLLTSKLDQLGFGVTLIDLAARAGSGYRG